MKTDHLAYQLATRVSWAGLLLQLVIAVVTLVAGFVTPDDATKAAAFFSLAGLPIWVCLIFLFHQHKLERLEALEAESLAAGGLRTSTIFEVGEEDLNVAARRLRWMHRYFVPAVSLLTAAAFAGLGWWQYTRVAIRLEGQTVDAGEALLLEIAHDNQPAWLLSIASGAAAALFIFSRYVSGMSKQAAWRDLRGGASATVGVSIVNIALAVAHGWTLSGSTTGARIMAWLIPIFTIAVGAEIGINFVLNLYRPRRPGEFPRAAFDSRILSLVAAPDTIAKSISDAINYQFGFEVSSTWFYRLLSRQIGPLVGFCVLLFVLLNCVAVVRPYEQGILLSFGRLSRLDESGQTRVLSSGLVLKWPWERLEKYPVYRIQEAYLGAKLTDRDEPLLWGKSHTSSAEDLIIFAPAIHGVKTLEASTAGTEDLAANNISVLNAEIPVFYQIRPGRLMDYLMFIGGAGSDSPQRASSQILAIAKRALTRHAATVPVDQALGPGRGQLAADLRRLVQEELDRLNSGIDIVFVGVAGVHPTVAADTNVAEAFEEVLLAEQERESRILEARAAAVKSLAEVAGSLQQGQEIAAKISALDRLAPDDPGYGQSVREIEDLLADAGGLAARQILDAEARRWERHMEARSRVVQENSRVSAYVAAPKLYQEREYLRALVELLGEKEGKLVQPRVVVTSPEVAAKVRVDLTEDPTAIDISGSISTYESSLPGASDE